ncbi:hypothetical protein [Microbacterium album]|uniref:Large exoprotein n=1 Tax=Microbacterium album TaxID=2053191 RepID=A0A917MLR7_9MICO|nr:hypothetical protein [Microbacterium album]GGH44036.1 hypothetical protein GCM10010921_18410 [Microbacterium album]
MDGQLLGGGVIAAVIVLLWLVYLLPTWQSKMRFNAAERNAVRLNQALRILAETSETPEEVRVELTAREAAAKQKLARRVQAERSRLQIEQDLLALERKRQELAAIRLDPALRQAKARRRVRLVATALVASGLAAAGLGTWALVAGLGALWLSVGAAVAIVGMATLQRMAAVQARAARRARPEPVAAPARRAPVALIDEADRGWVPRELPAPLTAVSGSRAQSAQAEHEAREALRRAAREEALRERAEALEAQERRRQPAPVPIETARPAAVSPTASSAAAGESPYARMGYVDDREIEEHVRQLLARRAAS